MPILAKPSRGPKPFFKVQCQICMAEQVPGFTPQTKYHCRYRSIAHRWRILQQQHLYNNNISCNPRNNDIGWITGHITLIWNELYSAWKLWNQDRYGKGEALKRQIKLDQVKRQILVLYHLQPLYNLTNHRKWFYANPEEDFLIVDTAAKEGHRI
jgi:hypothetical protein